MERDRWGNVDEWPQWPEADVDMCECHYYERIVVQGELGQPWEEPELGDPTQAARAIFAELGIEPG